MSADVRPAVDVKSRQVRRALSELVDAGYLAREDGGPERAHSYERLDDPGAGEVSIPDPGRSGPRYGDTRTILVSYILYKKCPGVRPLARTIRHHPQEHIRERLRL
jgi:hypothetical protein